MAEQGAAALSLRAIARQMGLTAPALYRYFRDRDALVTALVLDAFNAVADAMETAGRAATAAPLGDRLLAMCLAYRAWATAHPQDYLLIFGTPIPGYTAPDESTGPAAKRSFDVILNVMATAEAGQLRPLEQAYSELPASLQTQVETWRAGYGYAATSAALLHTLVAWTRMHGLVALELVGQLEPFFGPAGELYRVQMRKMIEETGLAVANDVPK
jgi:AcrR family transcriptional regulator